MTITMIAAMDRNRAIGIGNKLPWRLPAEMAFFTKMTKGKTVIMGRKTFESLPKPLKDRKNVILTRQNDFYHEECEVVHSIEEALERYAADEVMVIGGADVYEQFLPYAEMLLVTQVEVKISEADAFFPEIREEQWKRISTETYSKDERNAYDFTFQTFVRND
ncbi:MAG: dihydrofolate reductase [Candidatus Pristimantibacillus sp.]